MRILTKITLGVGVVMLIGSIVAIIAGGGSFMGDLVENPNGVHKWNGTAPTTYEGDFSALSLYYIFAEDDSTLNGTSINVTLVDDDENNSFIPCEDNEECDFYEYAGYTYLGRILVMTDGIWEVEFSGEGEVMIREQELDLGGLMAMGLGFWGACCSICVLGLGVIFIFALKDPPQQTGVLMVQPGQIPGQPIAGQAGVVQAQVQPGVPVGGAIHPAFEQQPREEWTPPSEQPPSQGF